MTGEQWEIHKLQSKEKTRKSWLEWYERKFGKKFIGEILSFNSAERKVEKEIALIENRDRNHQRNWRGQESVDAQYEGIKLESL